MLVEGQLEAADDNPITIGHEAVGQIVALGGNVKGFKKGDYIGFSTCRSLNIQGYQAKTGPVNAYRACFNCRGCDNHYIYCESGNMTMQGFACNGYFQEYCIIDPGMSGFMRQFESTH